MTNRIRPYSRPYPGHRYGTALPEPCYYRPRNHRAGGIDSRGKRHYSVMPFRRLTRSYRIQRQLAKK